MDIFRLLGCNAGLASLEQEKAFDRVEHRYFWKVLGSALNLLPRMVLYENIERAVLTVLPKKGDPYKIKNWRPVSLSCTCYKIFSKVLACRLRKVID